MGVCFSFCDVVSTTARCISHQTPSNIDRWRGGDMRLAFAPSVGKKLSRHLVSARLLKKGFPGMQESFLKKNKSQNNRQRHYSDGLMTGWF